MKFHNASLTECRPIHWPLRVYLFLGKAEGFYGTGEAKVYITLLMQNPVPDFAKCNVHG